MNLEIVLFGSWQNLYIFLGDVSKSDLQILKGEKSFLRDKFVRIVSAELHFLIIFVL